MQHVSPYIPTRLLQDFVKGIPVCQHTGRSLIVINIK